MTGLYSVLVLLVVGAIGGYLGVKCKIPAGALVGSLVAVICFKLVAKVDWEVPRALPQALQILLGIVVGASFQPEMIKTLGQVFLPVVSSTLLLMGAGIALTLLFTKTGILDMGTAYLATSPGAMSSLVAVALESGKDATVITCFHFFRLVLIILTMPLIYKFLLR